jgi:hypothetical protein
MKKTMTIVGLCAGLGLSAVPALAQAPAPATEKFFVNVNFGGQFSDASLDAAIAIPVYEETATLTSTTATSGGALFDASAGYRIWGDFFVALAVTWFGDTEVANYTTTVPHPTFFDRPAVATGRIEDLKRKEIGFHPQIVWAYPLTDRMDLALSAGPSFVRLTQDVVQVLTIPPGTQIGLVSVANEKGTAKGGHIGADVTYTFTQRYGGAAFLRYVGASVDLPSVPSVDTGGLQVGGGIRIRLF